MNSRELATQLQQGLLRELDGFAAGSAEHIAHVSAFRHELQAATLIPNSMPADETGLVIPWQQLFPDAGHWQAQGLPALIHALVPACRWFRADTLYPQPEHLGFSQRLWGAELVGVSDAVFDCAQRFILLLIVIEAHTSYPLHAHRIEETYFVLRGEGEWSHDDGDWTTLGPGGSFHNSSWQAHRIRSGDQPLICLGLYLPPFGWEGELL